MKNVLKIMALSAFLAGAVFAADGAPASSWFNSSGLSVKGSVGFESEYVYRGQVLAFDTVVSSLEGSYKLYNGSLYAGVLNHDSAHSYAAGSPGAGANFTESDFYLGYKLPVYEKFSADVGYTYYWYQSTGSLPNRRNEIYAGVVYNGLWVNPAAYVYYDFNLDAVTGEISGKYSWSLAKYGLANTALDVSAYIGGTSIDDVTGGQSPDGQKYKAGYAYYGATADLVYAFNKNANASVGVRYGGRGNNGGLIDSLAFPEKDSLYWGTKFAVGF